MAALIDDTLKPLPVEAVRMLAIDLDGTLLRSDGTISAASVKAVRAACAKGIRVVLATARPPRGSVKAYKLLELDTLTVCHNGALILDAGHGRVVDHVPLEGAVARRAVEIARKVGGMTRLGVDVIDTLHTDASNGKAGNPGASAPGEAMQQPQPAIPFDQVLNKPVTKVFMTGDPGRLAGVQSAVHQAMQDQVAFATSHLQLLQIVRAGVDKAAGLAKVAQHYGIPRESVMVIGDAPNDLGMFKWAGLSVAMKNGWRDVLKAAHFVVPSNDDDGVAEAIERYVLS